MYEPNQTQEETIQTPGWNQINQTQVGIIPNQDIDQRRLSLSMTYCNIAIIIF